MTILMPRIFALSIAALLVAYLATGHDVAFALAHAWWEAARS